MLAIRWANPAEPGWSQAEKEKQAKRTLALRTLQPKVTERGSFLWVRLNSHWPCCRTQAVPGGWTVRRPSLDPKEKEHSEILKVNKHMRDSRTNSNTAHKHKHQEERHFITQQTDFLLIFTNFGTLSNSYSDIFGWSRYPTPQHGCEPAMFCWIIQLLQRMQILKELFETSTINTHGHGGNVATWEQLWAP